MVKSKVSLLEIILFKSVTFSSHMIPSSFLNTRRTLYKTFSTLLTHSKRPRVSILASPNLSSWETNLPFVELKRIAAKFKCKLQHWPNTYLSLPLFGKPQQVSFEADHWKGGEKTILFVSQSNVKGCLPHPPTSHSHKPSHIFHVFIQNAHYSSTIIRKTLQELPPGG